MLPGDILSIVSTVAENWPIMKAFLPWVGTVMAVGFGTWLVMCLSFDVPRFVRRKVRERRDYWSSVIRRVADDIEHVNNELALHAGSKIYGNFRFDIDRLGDKQLFPILPTQDSQSGDEQMVLTARYLYQLSPIVETLGIRAAQRRVLLANQRWRENPLDPKEIRL